MTFKKPPIAFQGKQSKANFNRDKLDCDFQFLNCLDLQT